jgi:hypothetical protein
VKWLHSIDDSFWRRPCISILHAIQSKGDPDQKARLSRCHVHDCSGCLRTVTGLSVLTKFEDASSVEASVTQ